MLPRIRITDLLSEVARWTLFTDCFTHLRSGFFESIAHAERNRSVLSKSGTM